jgi:hypothetical protein
LLGLEVRHSLVRDGSKLVEGICEGWTSRAGWRCPTMAGPGVDFGMRTHLHLKPVFVTHQLFVLNEAVALIFKIFSELYKNQYGNPSIPGFMGELSQMLLAWNEIKMTASVVLFTVT